MSPQPMTMDELIERLGISKGSASQGLSFLRKAGAIILAKANMGEYAAGDRSSFGGTTIILTDIRMA